MIPYKQAATSLTHQRAILEIGTNDFPACTTVYTSGKDTPHEGWKCVFPDDTFRVVLNENIRLCW